MLLSRRLPLNALIALCRDLRHSLGAGLMLRDVFRQQSRRGYSSVRPVAARISQAIEAGDELRVALKAERAYFPPLFISLVSVGESTGNLPEIFAELEKYYLMQQRFRRQFISQSFLPVLQFVAATLIIAGLMVILGFIGMMMNTKPLDPLGFGLTGSSGALIFLAIVYGAVTAVVFLYIIISRSLRQKAVVDWTLLHIPIIGGFLQCLCLARLATALRLTLDSAMPIADAIGLSFQATGNAAYMAMAPTLQDSLRSGDDLSRAISKCRLLPEEFINIIAVAEEGGRVPEAMVNQAQYYEEEASRRLYILTRAASFAVWAFVAILIIMAIFRLFAIYLGAIEKMIP
jgi:type IV pilus assembly protein PilC